ncbi:MAG: histone deacetylase [Kiritimatiellae bacterium]|nr:histone deacetylase [Kiritimatiellia bacterium]MDD5521657.1 histone deacetylase [Kiritimatiellia bacterium]
MKQTGLICGTIYKEHMPGKAHPESPARYDAAIKGIAEKVTGDRILKIEPRQGTEKDVALCHTHEYIETARQDILSGWGSLSTGDTDVCEKSFDIALMAVGGVLNAVDAVFDGKVRNAFCAVRPPGHHATSERGMGFCIFNNVAIAARYAQKKHGIERVLIADWDIHHGNGTQEIFYEDPSVFYFSTHMWPFYPGTGSAGEKGTGKGKGFTLNCPMAAGSGRKEYVDAFNEKLVPAMKSFKPEFVLISAGFDGMANDPIGRHLMTALDYAELTGIIMNIASEYAGEKLVSSLEGGYNLSDLTAAVGAHVEYLAKK